MRCYFCYWLDDRLGRPEYRKHDPTKRVDGGRCAKNRRPALRQLQNVTRQVDA